MKKDRIIRYVLKFSIVNVYVVKGRGEKRIWKIRLDLDYERFLILKFMEFKFCFLGNR